MKTSEEWKKEWGGRLNKIHESGYSLEKSRLSFDKLCKDIQSDARTQALRDAANHLLENEHMFHGDKGAQILSKEILSLIDRKDGE